MIVRINIRQPYLRQQLNVEFAIASLAETFPFTRLFSDIIVLFLSNQDSLKIPPWENKKACKSFLYGEKVLKSNTNTVGALLTHYGYNDATNNHNSALQYISEENGRQTTYKKVLELFTSLGRFKE